MLDMFIFETTQMLEQLEQVIINCENSNHYDQESINEIFRIMHTVKGSSAMMQFKTISAVSHTVEDLFYYLRNEKPQRVEYSKISKIVLKSIDFIRDEICKIENGGSPDGDEDLLIEKIKSFLTELRNMNQKDEKYRVVENSQVLAFKAVVYFDDGCEMENIRAFNIIHNLKDIAEDIKYIPDDITDSNKSIEKIRKEGFQIRFKTDRPYGELHDFFSKTIFLKDLCLIELGINDDTNFSEINPVEKYKDKDSQTISSHHNFINVNVAKLDKLMDLVGELVISEAMVSQNPDLSGLQQNNFQKAARQHRKIINELQDIAMSIRMVPLSNTFQKMNRVVHDMTRTLPKKVELKIIGEETEVDKNIIEHISDPLMHLIRNSIDHGLETAEERKAAGKPEVGTITLEAKNAGGDVLIIVKDDGRGLNKEKILARAMENGLVNIHESEISDKEIYSYIFLPGFSTKDAVTEFSGRGVGMDVVTRNIGAVRGTVSIDSYKGEGTSITLKIPLTLAIMNGMITRIGNSIYTIPITSVKESFKINADDVITDPAGREMIMIRGECFPVLRLHEIFKTKTDIKNMEDGIVVMAENEDQGLCIFVDGLIGEQQVVVKALPGYIRNIKNIRGVAGCTLLGDGSISLILDIAGLLEILDEGR